MIDFCTTPDTVYCYLRFKQRENEGGWGVEEVEYHTADGLISGTVESIISDDVIRSLFCLALLDST